MAPDTAPGEIADPQLLAQLEALSLDPARPLLVVDADEVMVVFAAHLARFAEGEGLMMHLARYSLEGAFREVSGGRVLAFEEAIALINRFVTSETRHQVALEGAAAALERLSALAQIVVLTNVPRHGVADRLANLAGLGMGYPLVENGGGKGPALGWMAARAGRPTVFIDDSPRQIESAKATAPEVVTVHFTGAPMVAGIIPETEAADHRVASWAEAEPLIARLLA